MFLLCIGISAQAYAGSGHSVAAQVVDEVPSLGKIEIGFRPGLFSVWWQLLFEYGTRTMQKKILSSA